MWALVSESLLTITISMMRLMKDWLNNKHVIIANDVLAEMCKFVGTVNSSDALKELAFKIMQLALDKVQVLFLVIVNYAPFSISICRPH